MKIIYVLISIILIFTQISCSNPFVSAGDKLYYKAKKLDRSGDYINAANFYRQARAYLKKGEEKNRADDCRISLQRIEKITLSYPHTEAEVRKMIKEKYPGTSDERIDEVLKEGRLAHLIIGDQTYYFEDFLNTLYHIYPDFRSKEEAGALGRVTKLFDVMSKFIYEKDQARPGQVLVNPYRYLADGKMMIPRKELPDKGLLKVWLPLPLVTAAQTNIEIVSIYPRKYVKYPIKQDGDIGLVYMEIPLEEIEGNLWIGTKFKFTHYEERFKVDPEKIGEYDKESTLYKRYTASSKNIAITPAIRKTAKKIAGKETNPYKIAKKFYNHVVYDLDYSFTPHLALEALKIPESVFVQKHGYGDCGAQSMYFSALCRALGIPARASGGMQLFPLSKDSCGDHFWAQVYIPNYGWIPVDTSAGQIAKYMPHLTEDKRKDFINYFFANMDPYRYLIQHDVDIPPIPKPDEPPVFEMVLQEPTAICKNMEKSPGLLFSDSWQINVKRIY